MEESIIPSVTADTLRRALAEDVLKVFGLPMTPWMRRLTDPLLWLMTHRFCELAAQFDQQVARSGLSEATRWVLSHFTVQVEAKGVEHIPSEGPLVIAANHPGACDVLTIAAQVMRRDLKFLASGMPFFRSLPATSRYLIFVPRPHLGIHGRMAALRAAIHHLRQGGALVYFPYGRVEPDPVVMSTASETVEKWSPSLRVMLEAVPSSRVVIAAIGNVLSLRWARHPITRLRKELREQLLVAEICQVVQQMFWPRSLLISPRVHFAPPVSVAELKSYPGGLWNGLVTLAKARIAALKG